MILYKAFLLIHFDPSENPSEFCIFPIFPSTFPGHFWDPPWIAKIPFLDRKFSWFGEIPAELGVGGLKSAAFGIFLIRNQWEISEDGPGQPECRGVQHLRPLDTKSSGFHPKNPLGKAWQHLVGAEGS